MTLWFFLAMMTAAAVFAVLWPLGRRPVELSAGNDVRVYRDQLEEIDRDHAADRIGIEEAAAARIEVSRRLLAAAEHEAIVPPARPASHRRAVAIAALILVPLVSVGMYLKLGSPAQPGAPISARLEAPAGQPPIQQLVAQVEAHLEKNPDDGRGWEVLAPVYMQMGRFDEAVRARRNALAYNGATSVREADLGEALAAAAKGVVTADARQAFERALALDPKDAKAKYFIGLSAQQEGRAAEAAATWRDLLSTAPAGAAWTAFVREELLRIEGRTGQVSPGPNEQQIAAAEQMDPQQRRQMIAGMVEGLAEKLEQDGSDIEGWLRLVRAYTVLGEREKASAAVSDARRAAGNDPDKLRRLDELVKGLGLEG